MKKLLGLAAIALLSFGLGVGVSMAGNYGKQKVVYHINYDDPAHLNATLRNIQNHINAVGQENLDLRVVLHGNGVGLLQMANKDFDLQSKVVGLKAEGVKFAVCNNTLQGKKLDYKKDLYDVSAADIVPSGVAEIAALQGQGFAYLNP